MRIVHILVLVALSQATSFLRDTYTLIYDQSTSLFSEEELAKNTEIKQTKDDNTNYLDEQLTSLANAEQQQTLLAYEKDLPASGDCIILYSQCNFKGVSGKVCKDPSEAMSFQSPVFSLYIPDGQQFSTLDSNTQTEVTFLTSDDCLDQPIVMMGQLDFFIAQSSQYWIGESFTADQSPSLIQQEQSNVETENQTTDAPQTEQTEQAPVEQTQAEPEVQTQPQESQEQATTDQPQAQTEQPQEEQPQAEQPQAEQPQVEQPQAEQPQAEQPQVEQPEQTQTEAQPEAEQPQQQTDAQGIEDDKLVEQVLDKVEEVVEQVTDLQEAELNAQKEELKVDDKQPEQTEASIDDIPQTEVSEPEQNSETAEPLVGQTQLQK